LLATTLFPLQGLFNILIYTYPHVSSCRRNLREYSWFQAIREVIKSGGDSDQISSGRRANATRRSSSRQLQLVLQQSANRVINIRTSSLTNDNNLMIDQQRYLDEDDEEEVREQD